MPQEEEKLRKIWRLIYHSVRKLQIDDNFDRQLNYARKLNYVGKTDDFFFQKMCDLIFQSGMRGVVWQRYEPEIRRQFADYNVRKVAEFGEKDVERMMKNEKMFKHRRKIQACTHNAKEICKISKQFGGFSNFLSQAIPNLIEELKERMEWMSETNVRAFLLYVGLDVMKPDINVRRVFRRLGLIDSMSSNQKTLKQIQEVAEAMAKATGERVAVIDYTFYMFGAGEGGFVKHSICGVKPRCGECDLKEFCLHRQK